MGKRDPRVDAYIEKQREFARPILTYIRDVVHEGCPDVQETIKWGAPFFLYNGMLCQFAGFKEHVGFGFWKGTLIIERNDRSLEAAGSFGRITSVADLPPKKTLIGYLKQGMKLNDAGAKAPPKAPATRAAIPVPKDLRDALAKNRKAMATFAAFSPSHKREYLQWITEARQAATRRRRLAQAVEWMAEGKPRMWKYAR
jgi:uncharacterized protein YdeI (YjbR/CyaY-like superfamily)